MFSPTRIIFQKELREYFDGMVSVFIFAIYISISLIAAFYFGRFLQTDSRALEAFFRFQPEILAMIVPAICMRVWTDEYRTGTAEFILSQPVSYLNIVLGKFFAATVFGIIMLLLTLPLAVFTGFYADVAWLNVLSGYIGCILLICAFSAVSCAVSALSERPLITYLVSFFIVWGLVYLNPAPLTAAVFGIRHLPAESFMAHYLNFVSGQINLASVLYFSVLTIAGLWINTCAVGSRKY